MAYFLNNLISSAPYDSFRSMEGAYDTLSTKIKLSQKEQQKPDAFFLEVYACSKWGILATLDLSTPIWDMVHHLPREVEEDHL